MERSESITEIAKALSTFQGKVKNPKNTAENPHFKYKYAPLDEVLNIVRPLLAECGLSLVQIPTVENNQISVQTLLFHVSGEWIKFDPLKLPVDKPNAQGIGAAITYARRYALSSILGISSEDDDDANSISTITKEQAIALFKLADEETVKEVLTTLGYSRSLDIPVDKYNDVIKAIQQVAQEKKASAKQTTKTISEAQVKRLYTLSQGREEIVKEVLKKFNYESAKEVRKEDYDKICELVQKMVKERDKLDLEEGGQ